jgi:hypothetical protein
MHLLSTEEFSELCELNGMTVFDNSYSISAYERSSLEPSFEDVVRMYYNASTLL